MFWSRGRKNKILIRLLSILLVFSVLSTVVLPEAIALEKNIAGVEARVKIPLSFSFEKFGVPFGYGEIETKHISDSNKFVIHIQDAHCNYDAQIRISQLLKTIHDKYNIKNINLEGASGPFDLDIFTSIKEKNIRKSVADHFMQTGDICGAEYYAINEYKNTILWGVEDEDLYYRNLMVYRDFENNRSIIDKYITFLRSRLNKIIPRVFSKELADIYYQGEAYKSGKISFKEYLDFLCSQSKSAGISIDIYPNIIELFETSNIEEILDFKEAEKQREIIVDELEVLLSKNEKEILISKILAYSQKQISDGEFHDHLLKKIKHLGFDLNRFSSFAGYTAYIKAFEKVDYSDLMKEINTLVAELKKVNFTDQDQIELDRLLNNLERLTDITNFCLTRPDYERYLSDQFDCSVEVFRSFIKRHVAFTEKDSIYLDGLSQIDKLIKSTLTFYEYSFDRDKAFIGNLKYTSLGDKEVAILVTGGFHSTNLLKLFEKENISYISIIPKFNNNEGYVSPYYDLLSGKTPGGYSGLAKASSRVFNMAIASKLAPILAGYIWKESGVNAFDAAVIIQELLVRNDFKKQYKLLVDFNKSNFDEVLDGNNKPIVFGREDMPEEVISLKKIIAEAKARKIGINSERPKVKDYLIEIPKQTLKNFGKMYELHGRKFIVDGEKFVMSLEPKKGVFPFKISLKRLSDGKEVGYKGFAIGNKKPYTKIIGITEGGDFIYSEEYAGFIRGGMLEILEKVGDISYRDRKLGRLLMTNFGNTFPKGYLYETEIKNKKALSDMFDGKSFSDTNVGSIMREWKEVHWEFIDGLGRYYEYLSDLTESRKDEFLDQVKVYGAFIPQKNLLENSVFQWPSEKDAEKSKINGAWQDAKMKVVKENVPVQRSLFDELFGKGVLFSKMKVSIISWLGPKSWRFYENLIAPLWEEAIFYLTVPLLLDHFMGLTFLPALIVSRGMHIIIHYFNENDKDRFTAPILISLLVLFDNISLQQISLGFFVAGGIHMIMNSVVTPVINFLFESVGEDKVLGKAVLSEPDRDKKLNLIDQTISRGNRKVNEILSGTPEYMTGQNVKEIISTNFYEALLNAQIEIVNGENLLLVNVIISHDGRIMPFARAKKYKALWQQKYGPLFEVSLGMNVSDKEEIRRIQVVYDKGRSLPLKAKKTLEKTLQKINQYRTWEISEFVNLWKERQNKDFFSFDEVVTEEERGRLLFDKLREIINIRKGNVSNDMREIMRRGFKNSGQHAGLIDMVPKIAERLIAAYDIRRGDYFETISVRDNVRRFRFEEIDLDREVLVLSYPDRDGIFEIKLSEINHIRRLSGENFMADLKEVMTLKNATLEILHNYIQKRNPKAGSYDTSPAVYVKDGETLAEAGKKANDRIRRSMLKDYIKYLNYRTGITTGKVIECEILSGGNKLLIYQGIDLNHGIIVRQLNPADKNFYHYGLEKIKSVKVGNRSKDCFIGRQITDLDIQYQKKQFVCRDAYGEEGPPVDLKPVKYDVADLENDINDLKLDTSAKDTLLGIVELLKIVPPEFYDYNVLVEDLFGFARSYEKEEILPEGIVAVWHKLFENDRVRAVGLFHEIGHYLLDKNLLEIKIKGGKLIISSQGKDIGVPVFIRNVHSFRQIAKAYIEPEYFDHYCLRALQLELFGTIDFELSAFVYENKPKSDIIPGEIKSETDSAEEFGSELGNVVSFVSKGKASSKEIGKHVKFQKQRENGRIIEKHILYLKEGRELSFYLKKPDERYVEAFRLDLQHLAKEDGFTKEAEKAGLSVVSRVFTPEKKFPFLISHVADGERLRVRHITTPGSKVPENILFSLGKMHGLGILHRDLTHFLLDNEYGPSCINFNHIYVEEDGSIQIIDFGEAAAMGEEFAGKNDLIEEREEVLDSIMNLASLNRQELLSAYEKGKAQMIEKRKQEHREQNTKARGVIQDMFAERAKAAIGDLRQKRMDIVVMPGSSDHISRQKEIDSKVRRKLARDYGQETVAFNYIYSHKWRDNLASIMRHKVTKEFTHNKENSPRILLYLPILPEEARDIFEEKGLLHEFRELREHITVIAEENIPDTGIIDEVMHIVLAKALLNYERFRKGDYGKYASYNEEALMRLENFLKILVDNPERIDIKKDPEIINKIIDGIVSLKIRRIDFSEITQWKDQQDAVLVSL